MILDLQHLFDGILSIMVVIIGGIIKFLHGKTERSANDLADFKQYVAINHPTNTDINRKMDKMDEKMDKLIDKIDRVLMSKISEAE